jgi:hypothetical protein
MQSNLKLFLLLILPLLVNAADFKNAWDIIELAKSEMEQIELRNSRRIILKRVDANQHALYLYR